MIRKIKRKKKRNKTKNKKKNKLMIFNYQILELAK